MTWQMDSTIESAPSVLADICLGLPSTPSFQLLAPSQLSTLDISTLDSVIGHKNMDMKPVQE